MKKALAVTLALCLALFTKLSLPLCSAPAVATAQCPSISAESAVLIDGEGKTVYEKNADERMGMASTTKIMTALIVAENLPPDRLISIPKEAVNVEGSSVYLCEGELLSVEQLLYALMLSSANDAAVALAISTSGSIESFASLMNQRARELGLSDTNFVNPHGLYDESHYTTAHDLALISLAALNNELIARIASTKKATVPQGVTPDAPDGTTLRYLYNHNKMLSLYKGAIGLKTGFTRDTGRCLVSAAERDGLRLIAVTLNAPDDWRDHTAMLDYGFAAYSRVTLYGAGEFTYVYPISNGKEQYVILTNTLPITLTLAKDGSDAVCSVLSHQRFELAPVTEGDILATLRVSAEGREASSPLRAISSVEALSKKKQ